VKCSSVVAGTAIGAIAAVIGVALAGYPGSTSVFVVFNLCLFALFALHPRNVLSLRPLRLAFNIVFNRIGHRLLWTLRVFLRPAGSKP
jgi:hypothetical protein